MGAQVGLLWVLRSSGGADLLCLDQPNKKWIGGPGDPMKFMEFLGWYPFAIGHGLNPLLNSYVNLPGGPT
jgi:hypothetical protein